MPKFEAHITFERTDETVAKLKDGFNGWSYSAITDDPIMGQKPYVYLTNYSPFAKKLLIDMKETVGKLDTEGIKALRTKIERIIFDSKTGWNEVTLHS
jgi:hypothetical protein